MILCKLCILQRGVSIESAVANEDELLAHIEREHHTPVRRENESREACLQRFGRENPAAGGPNCKCMSCVYARQTGKPTQQHAHGWPPEAT